MQICSGRMSMLAAATLTVFSVGRPDTASADNFKMSVQVRQGQRQLTTRFTRQQPAPKKQPPRLIFKIASGKKLQVRWSATNTGTSETEKNVLVHFFVVQEEKPGQPKVPPLGKDVEHEGAITVDFKPGDRAGGEFTVTPDKPGSYLIRVETIGLANSHGHEHYAALDLVVE